MRLVFIKGNGSQKLPLYSATPLSPKIGHFVGRLLLPKYGPGILKGRIRFR